jgi:hypothetical protein
LTWAGYWTAGDPSAMTFDIGFYENNAGVPGAEIDYFADVGYAYTATGQSYAGFPAYYFEFDELPNGVDMAEGFISVQSQGTTDSDILLWGSAKTGDGFSYQAGATPPETLFDRGVRLYASDIVWMMCGEADVCVNVNNIGTFDEVDDPSTVCDWEGISLDIEITHIYQEDPCDPPIETVVFSTTETLELLCGEDADVCVTYHCQEAVYYEIDVFAVIDPSQNSGDGIDCDTSNNGDTIMLGLDCCPPESEHQIDPAFPDGNNNWYTTDVEVVIMAEDPLCPDPCLGTSSGLGDIFYKLNGELNTYDGAFDIDEEGVNLVEYWAVDNAGNEEEHFTFEVAIDTSDPDVDMVFEKIEDGTLQVEFTAIVADTVSGIEKVEFYIGSSLELTVTEPPYKYLITWQDSYKTETFKAVAYDLAGNSGQATVAGSDIPGARVTAAQSTSLPSSLPTVISQNI